MAKRPKADMSALAMPKGQAHHVTPAPAAPAARGEGVSRAVTLRLGHVDYQRLRRYAFETERTHQALLQEALDTWLKGKGF